MNNISGYSKFSSPHSNFGTFDGHSRSRGRGGRSGSRSGFGIPGGQGGSLTSVDCVGEWEDLELSDPEACKKTSTGPGGSGGELKARQRYKHTTPRFFQGQSCPFPAGLMKYSSNTTKNQECRDSVSDCEVTWNSVSDGKCEREDTSKPWNASTNKFVKKQTATITKPASSKPWEAGHCEFSEGDQKEFSCVPDIDCNIKWEVKPGEPCPQPSTPGALVKKKQTAVIIPDPATGVYGAKGSGKPCLSLTRKPSQCPSSVTDMGYGCTGGGWPKSEGSSGGPAIPSQNINDSTQYKSGGYCTDYPIDCESHYEDDGMCTYYTPVGAAAQHLTENQKYRINQKLVIDTAASNGGTACPTTQTKWRNKCTPSWDCEGKWENEPVTHASGSHGPGGGNYVPGTGCEKQSDGSWKRIQKYTKTKSKMGDGASCDFDTGDERTSLDGAGACYPPVNCVYKWEDVEGTCQIQGHSSGSTYKKDQIIDVMLSAAHGGTPCPTVTTKKVPCDPQTDCKYDEVDKGCVYTEGHGWRSLKERMRTKRSTPGGNKCHMYSRAQSDKELIVDPNVAGCCEQPKKLWNWSGTGYYPEGDSPCDKINCTYDWASDPTVSCSRRNMGGSTGMKWTKGQKVANFQPALYGGDECAKFTLKPGSAGLLVPNANSTRQIDCSSEADIDCVYEWEDVENGCTRVGSTNVFRQKQILTKMTPAKNDGAACNSSYTAGGANPTPRFPTICDPKIDCVGQVNPVGAGDGQTNSCRLDIGAGGMSTLFKEKGIYDITTAKEGSGAECPHQDGDTVWGSVCDKVDCVATWEDDPVYTCRIRGNVTDGVDKRRYEKYQKSSTTGPEFGGDPCLNLTPTRWVDCPATEEPVDCAYTWEDIDDCVLRSDGSYKSGQKLTVMTPQKGLGKICEGSIGDTKYVTACDPQFGLTERWKSADGGSKWCVNWEKDGEQGTECVVPNQLQAGTAPDWYNFYSNKSDEWPDKNMSTTPYISYEYKSGFGTSPNNNSLFKFLLVVAILSFMYISLKPRRRF